MAKDIYLANRHSAPVILGRMYNPNISGDPAAMKIRFEQRSIMPGHVEVVPGDEWDLRKGTEIIKYYLDQRILEIVKRDREVEVTNEVVAELEIPEHLQPDTDGNVSVPSAANPGETVKAGIRRASKSTVKVE